MKRMTKAVLIGAAVGFIKTLLEEKFGVSKRQMELQNKEFNKQITEDAKKYFENDTNGLFDDCVSKIKEEEEERHKKEMQRLEEQRKNDEEKSRKYNKEYAELKQKMEVRKAELQAILDSTKVTDIEHMEALNEFALIGTKFYRESLAIRRKYYGEA